MFLTKQQKQDEFNKIWAKYPNKDSRKRSELHYLSSIKTYQDIESINKALDNYLSMLKREEWRKVKSGSTWFNNWQDWLEYEEERQKSSSYKARPLTLEEREQVKYSFSDACQDNICMRLAQAWKKAQDNRRLNLMPSCGMW